jgi:hypothetical protein
MNPTYRIEEVEGCIVVYGSVPLAMMGSVLENMDKSAVMSNEMQNILKATLVAGTPANLKRLKAVTEKPAIPAELRTAIGPGAANWVETGRVGLSSNFILSALTGFNAMGWLKHGDSTLEARVSYPLDPDDLTRCRHLLEAAPELGARIQELGAISGVWKSLANQWGALCTLMDMEAPDWRLPEGSWAAPKTYVLMRKIIAESPNIDPAIRPRDRSGS